MNEPYASPWWNLDGIVPFYSSFLGSLELIAFCEKGRAGCVFDPEEMDQEFGGQKRRNISDKDSANKEAKEKPKDTQPRLGQMLRTPAAWETKAERSQVQVLPGLYSEFKATQILSQ